MKILVTGSEGFIGKHLCRKLSSLGHELCEVDLVIGSDAADGAWYERFKPDVVIHLAAQTSVRRSIDYPEEDAAENILTTIEAVKAAKEVSVKRFIFASSGGAIYQSEGWYHNEGMTPYPTTPYGLSKLTCERYLWMLRGSMDVTILRLSNVYGLGQKGGESGVIPIFINAMKTGQKRIIYGDGEQTRDYVHVSDVCDAFVKALDGPPGTYNVGTGRETSVNAIHRILGGGESWMALPLPKGEPRRNSLDCTKAKNLLGWEPTITLEDGLAELLK